VTFPHVTLAQHAHDRLGIRRLDDEWLTRQWRAPQTRVLLVRGARVQPVAGAIEWLDPFSVSERLGTDLAEEQLRARRILLGERDGRTWFALVVDGLMAELVEGVVDDFPEGLPATEVGVTTEDESWLSLRDVLLGSVADLTREAPLVFHAVGLAEWHRATRFCPRCGGDLESRAAGHELVCQACGRVQFPRTDPAVIMAITHGQPGSDQEALLLGRQASWPPGRFSTLAGFVEPGESLEDAVRREVMEEVGVQVGEVEYFGNQAWPFPASLMLGLTGRARVREVNVDRIEIAEARWFTRAELLEASRERSVLIPRGVSISSSLVQHWFGAPLPGTW
jgi:NAD+ diphosphatase